MATTKTDAQKVQEYRKQAQDKTLPQEVRDMADMKANAIEAKSVEAKAGVKLAKGGVVAKTPKKMAVGGVSTLVGRARAGMNISDMAPVRDKTAPIPATSTARPARVREAITPSVGGNMIQPRRAVPEVARKPQKYMAKGGSVPAKAPVKKAVGKAPTLVIAVGMGKTKGKTAMAKGGSVKKGK